MGCCRCRKHRGKCRRRACRFVKDKVTTGWSIPQGSTQSVYQIVGLENVHASGFIAYDEGEIEAVTIRFYDGSSIVGNPLIVYEGSSVIFTATRFDRIEITVPLGNANYIASGLLCVTPRYQLNIENEHSEID